MSAVPLTDSLADIAERKEKMIVLFKHVGMSGVYLCAVIAYPRWRSWAAGII